MKLSPVKACMEVMGDVEKVLDLVLKDSKADSVSTGNPLKVPPQGAKER